ncbi:toll/interleukin-1 receptor domain-containing protein [Bacillus wiedmannii]|uniref:toll/interleukin-1 receptor domain-containing protein n=1 Tax=Bacillus wiedmannii TaxID=1890302 RepID=UPI0034D54B5F
MSQNDFFISHATADCELVAELVDFMEVALKVDRSKIYCTSGVGTKKIRTGTNFIEDIKDNVIGTKLVIFILTPNYFKSNFCLAELGAAWALSSVIYPIVIPPTPRELLKSTPLSEATQALTLNTYDDLITMADDFKEMNIAEYSSVKLLNTRAHKLIDWIKGNCSFEIDDTVSKAEHLAVQDQLEKLKTSIRQKDMELAFSQSKHKTVLKLERARTTERINLKEEEETTSEWDWFKSNVKDAKRALSKIDDIVISAIYYYEFHRGEARFCPIHNDFISRNRVNELYLEGLIDIDEVNGEITPNYESGLVRVAVDELHALSYCISNYVNSEMKQEFAEKNKFNLEFKSKTFWEKILNVTIYV